MIVSIDFDGTLVEGDNYPEIGVLKPNVKDIIKRWKDDGNIIIVNSCRTGRYEAAAVDFLLENDIPFDYFNCNHPKQIEHYKMDSRKISADVYIDDKQVGGLPDWFTIDKIVRKHEKYERSHIK